MNRRNLLSSVVVFGLCGCSEITSSEPVAESDETDELHPMELLTDQDQTDWPVKYELQLRHKNMQSPNDPLTLMVELTNTTDNLVTYQDRFWALGERASDDSWMFIGKDIDPTPYEANEDNNLWLITAHRHRQSLPIEKSLESGESITQLLALGHLSNNAPQLPTKLEFDIPLAVEYSSDEMDFEYSFSLVADVE